MHAPFTASLHTVTRFSITSTFPENVEKRSSIRLAVQLRGKWRRIWLLLLFQLLCIRGFVITPENKPFWGDVLVWTIEKNRLLFFFFSISLMDVVSKINLCNLTSELVKLTKLRLFWRTRRPASLLPLNTKLRRHFSGNYVFQNGVRDISKSTWPIDTKF